MANQESRLAIVIDTSNAKAQLKQLSSDLKKLERDGLSISKSLSKVGGTNYFTTLNKHINSTQNSLNAFAKTTKNTTNALSVFEATAKRLRTSTAGIAKNLNASQSAMARFNASSKTVSSSLQGVGDNAKAMQSNLGIATRAMDSARAEADKLKSTLKTLNTDIAALNRNLKTSVGAFSRFSQSVLGVNTRLNTFGNTINQSQARLRLLDGVVANTRNQLGSLGVTANNINTFFRSMNASTAQLSIATNALNAATARANTTITRLGGGLNQSNVQARGLLGSLTNLQNILAGGMFGLYGLSVLKTADEMQNLNSLIKLVTNSEEEYLGIRQKVRQIADENYNDISATTNLYQKSAVALANLGKSQAEALEFTKAVSLAMRTGGRSAQEQASAIMQLGQAMGAGVVQGDEFRSIAENAPILLELVAKRMGVLPGQLKELAAEGKVTAEIMYDALTGGIGQLETLAEKMPVTMSQAFAVTKNQYKKFLGDFLNDTTGFSGVMASAIAGVGKNFESLAAIIGASAVVMLSKYAAGATAAMMANSGLTASSLALTGSTAAYTAAVSILNKTLGAYVTISGVVSGVTSRALQLKTMGVSGAFAAATASIRSGVTALGQWSTYAGVASGASTRLAGATAVATGGFVRFATILNKHPLMFMATVMFGVVASTEGLEGAMQSLGDVTGVVGIILGDFISMGVNGFGSLLNSAGQFVSGFVNSTKDGANKGSANFSVFFEGTEKGFVGILQGLTRMVDAAIISINSAFMTALAKIHNSIIWMKNQYNNLKGFFGFENNQSAYVDSSFASIMDYNYERLGGNLFGSIVDNATSRQKDKKATASYTPSTSAMNSTKAAQYQTLKAANAMEAAAKEQQKSAKEQQKSSKSVTNALQNARLVGISGNTGVGSGAHLDIRYARGDSHYGTEVRKEHLARFQANGKALTDYRMTSGFGPRNTGIKGASKYHLGTDFAMPVGTPITTKVPVKNVSTWEDKKGGGYVSTITFADGLKINLLHQSKKVMGVEKGASTGNSKLDSMVGKAESNYIDSMRQAQLEQEQLEAQRLKIRKEWATKQSQLEYEHKERVKEIKDAKLPEKEETAAIVESERRMERELAVYEKGLDDKVDALGEFQRTEAQLLKDHYESLKTELKLDPELSRPENEERLKQALEYVDAEYEYKLAKHNIMLEQQKSELLAYQKTEREIISSNWDNKIAEAMLATDELRDLRIESLKEQKDKELALFDLTEKQKILELKENQMTEIEFIEQKYQLEKSLIEQMNESEEVKQAQRLAKAQEYWSAVKAVRDKAQENYDAQTRGLYGYTNEYAELDANNQNQINIAREAYEAGIIQEQEYKDRLLEIEQDFVNKKQAILVGGYQSAFGMAANVMKAFGKENSRAYKALIAVDKALAFSRVFLANKVALTQAWSSAPFPYNLPAVATTALQTGVLAQAVESFTPKGFMQGGYTGNLPTNAVAGAVHGQEYVFDAQSTKRIGVNNLERIRRGDSVSSTEVKVEVHNYSSAKVETQTDSNGNVVMIVRDEIKKSWANLNKPSSFESNQLKRHTTARTKLA